MERKNYLGLGIVLAIFAALVSLMCIAFSYADINELNATENAEGEQIEAVVGGEEQTEATEEANGTFTITLNINAPEGSCNITYDNFPVTNNTITTADCLAYTLTQGDDSTVVKINDGSSKDLVVELNNGYVSNGWVFTSGSHSENTTISLVVSALTSFNISGKIVMKDDTTKTISNAYVQLSSSKDDSVFVEAYTNSAGEYSFKNVPLNALLNSGLQLFTTAKGFGFNSQSLSISDLPGGKDVITQSLGVNNGYINIDASAHHIKFIVNQTVTQGGKTNSYTWICPFIGLPFNTQLNGVEFKFENDGSISGEVTVGSIYSSVYTIKPYCEEGYSFDNWDVNGNKLYGGDTFTIDTDVANYQCCINYKYTGPVENISAQTGDAIPFAAIVGLGMIVAVAFVVVRKKFN